MYKQTDAIAISQYLLDQTYEGPIIMEFGLGNSCKCYIMPRDTITDMVSEYEELRRYCIYILLGEDEEGTPMAYIGESKDFSDREKTHNLTKKFWNKAMVFISTANDIYQSEVDYLEHLAQKTAKEAGSMKLDNKRIEQEPDINPVVKGHLNKFFKNIMLLTKIHGYPIFEKPLGSCAHRVSPSSVHTPRYSSQTNLPAYLRYLSNSTMREMLVNSGVRTDIIKTADINELKAIRKLIKQQEKSHKPRIHNTYSCSISKYIEYLEHGFTYQDMQHDALLVDEKKQTETPKAKPKAKQKVPKEKKPRKKPDPPFKFWMIDMPVGTVITFAPTGVQVRVASNDTIEYQGRIYSLSGFCATFMPEDRRIPAGQYQGPAYFTYNGKTLKKIRKERERK